MNKKWLFLGFGISLFALAGCGQLNKLDPNPGDTDLSPLNSAKHVNIIATSKIKITLGDKKSGVSAQSIETSLIASQSVEIEADVPSFMTFQANSSIFFNVTQLGLINADGTITLNVVYNDLISQDLQGVRVRAYMVESNGLHGQQVSGNIIPLDIQVVNGIPYQPLTTSSANMKVWNAPFMQAINEQVVLKLRGNFTYALKQQYKGTIMLEFVRDENIDSLPPGMPTNFTASAGDQRVTLNWTNPADNDLKEVELRVATNNYPISVTDGTLVYKGLNQSYIHTGLTNGATYYYSIFARDNDGNVSSGNRVSATPQSPPDQYTKLLLHMDGNGESFVDSSGLNNPVYAAGDATQTSSQMVFGGKSAYFDGTGDFVCTNTSPIWDLDIDKFTIDYWVKFAAINAANNGIFDQNNFYYMNYGGTNHELGFIYYDWNYGGWKGVGTTTVLTTNTWYHVAVARNGANLLLYLNGVQVGSRNIGDYTIPGNTGALTIGYSASNASMSNLYIDEFRFSKGIARWTGPTFNVPTNPY
ncbi:MAG: hypothetical protein DKM50_06910 [Candidatus Margulisiibacteriota bacterium]|nr:MAG: hypothetical protein A2X43_10865 [Candidatus Margulisbacteria bacterium GWD2_39_127]PZM79904.1 MAG: hypothetical protein DKM50_06910 [Candidatus Margulisiibacteriota bacterium]HAR62822.1 hypothetical protein [Candidatus Margulisiibacteriota bacterium]HCY35652.1 hypothetical protein [Candidatus Margulisiibacteriota bacterium]